MCSVPSQAGGGRVAAGKEISLTLLRVGVTSRAGIALSVGRLVAGLVQIQARFRPLATTPSVAASSLDSARSDLLALRFLPSSMVSMSFIKSLSMVIET